MNTNIYTDLSPYLMQTELYVILDYDLCKLTMFNEYEDYCVFDKFNNSNVCKGDSGGNY